MNLDVNDFLAVNPLRLANDFLATLPLNRERAIATLRVDLTYMEESQIRLWIDCLAELMVDEAYDAVQWQDIFSALEAVELDSYIQAA